MMLTALALKLHPQGKEGRESFSSSTITNKISTTEPVCLNDETSMNVTNNTPVRETENLEGEDFETEEECETFNPHAELTDGYESNLDNPQQDLDFDKLSYLNSDEELDKPLNEKFAEILNKSWSCKKNFDSIKKNI